MPWTRPGTYHDQAFRRRRVVNHRTGRQCATYVDGMSAPQATTATAPVAAVHELRAGYREDLGPGERGTLISWLAFTTTFAAVRAITYSIRDQKGPFRNLTLGGAHVHHYMWGIGMLSAVGAVAVRGDDRLRRHPVVAGTYGSAIALIIDEFALLLDLKDVYWAKQGRLSVDIGIGTVALGGLGFASLPLIRRLARRFGPGRR
jgi:hypothetical protein